MAGKNVIHHSPENKKLFPNLINVPNDGVVGGTPTPKKLNVDSANIELGIVKVNVTIKGANMFGRISLKMICIFPKPFNRAKNYNIPALLNRNQCDQFDFIFVFD